MRRGAWHQCGANNQKFILEMLQNGTGVGAILSPKDLAYEKAQEYAGQYKDAGADVLLDPQFYEPDFANDRLSSYPIAQFRQSIASLGALSAPSFASLTAALLGENQALGSSAVIAPAIPYEAARPDIAQLNARLFAAAKAAGDSLGIPTYATIVIGGSVTTAQVAQSILSQATGLNADGWYYAVEFDSAERLPTDVEAVFRYCSAGLTLACTGKPVLHAYAGPLAGLAFGSGARAAAIGFWQNLWGFTRSRFQPSTGQGGGGDAPPRFFSTPLWGTIVYPDELLQLPPALQSTILLHSPYSGAVSTVTATAWQKWDSYRHMVHQIITYVSPLAASADARQAMQVVVSDLASANALHTQVHNAGLLLRDGSNSYQPAWASAGTRMIADMSGDYQWLQLQGGP
ncbi:hypothetical protein [Donghicola sp. XS_ASV15]|uniref:hypothetical protein n=1 Tax=Donghicola sp. XS_ASV15 TaxID=3241295 RepID=UPI0035156A8A